jgi:hypothetical protein
MLSLLHGGISRTVPYPLAVSSGDRGFEPLHELLRSSGSGHITCFQST